MSDLDRELEEVLRQESKISDKLVSISKIFIRLLSKLYGCEDLHFLIQKFLGDVCRTREFVLALYFPLALLLVRSPELANDFPEEISRQYLSILLVLYEKSKHVYLMCRGENLDAR